MSRTTHHRGQKDRRNGHDYGGRYKCNESYNQNYGTDGRDRANSERRNEDKRLVRVALNSGENDDKQTNR